jgi:predicted PurR-regulated permease PerM
MNVKESLQRHFLLVLVIAAVALTVMLVWPFWSSLLVASVLAATSRVPMSWLVARLKGRRELAAGLLVITLVVALILPVAALLTVIAGQAIEGFNWLREALSSQGIAGLVARLPSWLEPLARRFIDAVPELQRELQQQAGAGGGQAVAAVSNVLAATGGAIVRLLVTLIAYFFLLVDGHKLVGWAEANAPMAPGQFRELVGEFRRTAVSVLVATVATAGLQSLAALVGYLLAAAPGPIFLTTVTFLVALVPAVGGTVVVLAVALLQYATGHELAALFLLVWGVGVVSTVDTLARPYLLRGGMAMPIGIVFLALLGGVAAFGVIGVLLGPLTVTFLMAAVRFWHKDVERVGSTALEAATWPGGDDDRGDGNGETGP